MGTDADLSHPRAYWNDGRPLDVGHRRMACPDNASPSDDVQRNLRKHSGGGIWSVEADDSRIVATLSRRTRRGGGGITLCRSGGGRFSPAVQFRPALRLAGVFCPRTRISAVTFVLALIAGWRGAWLNKATTLLVMCALAGSTSLLVLTAYCPVLNVSHVLWSDMPPRYFSCSPGG